LLRGREQWIFRLAASLAGGIPVDLSVAVAGLDQANLQRVVTAIRHTSGIQQLHEPPGI
jgi:hypothetical protein